MGSDSTGRKEIIGLTDGYRESEASWLELLEQLCEQGFTVPPEVAVGDGALGFWWAGSYWCLRGGVEANGKK